MNLVASVASVASVYFNGFRKKKKNKTKVFSRKHNSLMKDGK